MQNGTWWYTNRIVAFNTANLGIVNASELVKVNSSNRDYLVYRHFEAVLYYKVKMYPSID